MTWSIAQAKQHLSEVVRLAANEPQPIYNRGRLVGALIDADTFRAFEQWRIETRRTTVAEQFEILRAELAAEADASRGAGPKAGKGARGAPIDGLTVPARADRPNAFTGMLDVEASPDSARGHAAR